MKGQLVFPFQNMYLKKTFLAIYTGRITEILENGIMLQLHDRIPPVLLHNTHLTAKKIRHPSVLGLEVGQDLQVGAIQTDQMSICIKRDFFYSCLILLYYSRNTVVVRLLMCCHTTGETRL